MKEDKGSLREVDGLGIVTLGKKDSTVSHEAASEQRVDAHVSFVFGLVEKKNAGFDTLTRFRELS